MVLLLVIVMLAAALAGYLWWRLIRGTTTPGRTRRWLTVVIVALTLAPVAADALNMYLPAVLATPLEWLGYSWLALLLYLFFATVAMEPIRFVLLRRERARSVSIQARSGGAESEQVDQVEQVAEPSRRLLIGRSLAIAAGSLAVATVGTGAWFANSTPEVRRVPITLTGLDPAFDGFRIVLISDVHLSSTYTRSQFRRVIDLVNSQRPDMVAVVGDLVDGDLDELGGDASLLADLVTEQGVFFVTGNHEYYVDTENWMRYLPTLGVRVLRNERVTLRRGNARLDVAGIDDRTAEASGVAGHGADLDAALAGRDQTVPVVLLAHQPALVEQAAVAGVDLQLSGHTHGAQMWPFEYIIALDQPLLAGLGQFGQTQLYVTTGTGYWGPSVRLGSRPEISVIELQSPRS
jgi:predicted MPP superfamily phosphohydrolase